MRKEHGTESTEVKPRRMAWSNDIRIRRMCDSSWMQKTADGSSDRNWRSVDDWSTDRQATLDCGRRSSRAARHAITDRDVPSITPAAW